MAVTKFIVSSRYIYGLFFIFIFFVINEKLLTYEMTLIARLIEANMGPICTQAGPMLAPWTLPSGNTFILDIDIHHN